MSEMQRNKKRIRTKTAKGGRRGVKGLGGLRMKEDRTFGLCFMLIGLVLILVTLVVSIQGCQEKTDLPCEDRHGQIINGVTCSNNCDSFWIGMIALFFVGLIVIIAGGIIFNL